VAFNLKKITLRLKQSSGRKGEKDMEDGRRGVHAREGARLKVVSVELAVGGEGSAHDIVLGLALNFGGISSQGVVSGLADDSVNRTKIILELEIKVEGTSDAVLVIGPNEAFELDEEVIGLNLEMVDPLVTEGSTIEGNGSPALAAGQLVAIESGRIGGEINLAAVYLNADRSDVSYLVLAAVGLEEPIQLNMLGGEQVEPFVGEAHEIKLVSIEAGEVRIAPNVTGDGIGLVAARGTLDVHVREGVGT
jgi:hypothetical protein